MWQKPYNLPDNIKQKKGLNTVPFVLENTMAKACQLYSGSSGNCIYISNKETKILIDAGVTAKRIDEGLSAIGEDGDSISAIFVTHEHTDHIRGIRVFAERHNIPVFAKNDVFELLSQSGNITSKMSADILYDNMELDGIEIIPFANSHDSISCTGYRFNLPNGKSIGICTDTGYVTESAREALLGCDMVYLESNHEVRMLQNGSYPYPLKQRILSDFGHLSNQASAEFAKDLVKGGTTRIILAHLSRENNLPDIARQTALSAMEMAGFVDGRDYRLGVSSEINHERPVII